MAIAPASTIPPPDDEPDVPVGARPPAASSDGRAPVAPRSSPTVCGDSVVARASAAPVSAAAPVGAGATVVVVGAAAGAGAGAATVVVGVGRGGVVVGAGAGAGGGDGDGAAAGTGAGVIRPAAVVGWRKSSV